MQPRSKYKQKIQTDTTPLQVGKQPPSFGGAAVWISGITLFVTLLSITFYGAGKAYRVAYLSQFGATDTLLPWSTQDLIYLGIVKQLDTIIWTYPALAVFILVMILYLWVSYKLGKYFEAKRTFKASFEPRRNIDKAAPYSETAFLLLLLLTGLVLFVSAMLGLAYVARAERLGGTDGRSDYKMMIEGDLKALEKRGVVAATIEVLKDGKSHSSTVFTFSCSEKACLGIERPTKTVLYLPLDKIITFRKSSAPIT